VGGEAAIAGRSNGDVYAVPTPSGSGSFTGSFFAPPFTTDSQPLLIPGPYVVSFGVGTDQTFSSTQNFLAVPASGTGGSRTAADITTSSITVSAANVLVEHVSVSLDLIHSKDSDLI